MKFFFRLIAILTASFLVRIDSSHAQNSINNGSQPVDNGAACTQLQTIEDAVMKESPTRQEILDSAQMAFVFEYLRKSPSTRLGCDLGRIDNARKLRNSLLLYSPNLGYSLFLDRNDSEPIAQMACVPSESPPKEKKCYLFRYSPDFTSVYKIWEGVPTAAQAKAVLNDMMKKRIRAVIIRQTMPDGKVLLIFQKQ